MVLGAIANEEAFILENLLSLSKNSENLLFEPKPVLSLPLLAQ